ncbi:MAG: WD40 repeat domain-containing protein [Gemmataceae bacterium]
MRSTALPPFSPPEPPRSFGAPGFHTDGDLLAIGLASDGVLWSVEDPGELRGWSLATRRLVVSRPLESFASLWTFNWAARLLASASDEVVVWEVASGQQLATLATPSWITAVAFQPGAAVLATGHDDGSVRVWDWADQKMLLELDGHDSEVSAVAFRPDQRVLATAGEDKRIHLWDLPTGQRVGTLDGHKDRIPGLAWHPDNRRLFSAGWDTTVRVWDTQACQPIILLNSHATQVHALALSADGKLLASADSRIDVHLWDTGRNETVTVVREATGEVRSWRSRPATAAATPTPPCWRSVGPTGSSAMGQPLGRRRPRGRPAGVAHRRRPDFRPTAAGSTRWGAAPTCASGTSPAAGRPWRLEGEPILRRRAPARRRVDGWPAHR